MKQLELITRKRAHIAIMRKSWGLTEKIRSGEKTIESRWYLNKIAPWNEINADDTLYFKNSGEPIALSSKVEKVVQFAELTPKKVREILHRYGEKDGLDIGEMDQYYEFFKDKRYCILIFLKEIQKIESFEIEKKGFGSRSAWITLDSIENIKKIKSSRFKQRTLIR